MRCIQSLEFKIKRGVHDDRQFDIRLRFLRFPGRGFFRLRGGITKFRAKLLLKFSRDLPQGSAVFRVHFFHHGREFEGIAFGPAAEALEYTALEICRERWRVFLSIVIRQGTEAVMLFAFTFDLDAVVPKHLFKVEPLAKLFEVYPCFHSVISRVEGVRNKSSVIIKARLNKGVNVTDLSSIRCY